MTNGLPRSLSQQDALQLRRKAVAQAEAAFKGSKGRRVRHAARLQLAHNRRALQAIEEAMSAQH